MLFELYLVAPDTLQELHKEHVNIVSRRKEASSADKIIKAQRLDLLRPDCTQPSKNRN